MNSREFQEKYHEYMTEDKSEAEAERDKVGLIDGQPVEVVGFPICGRTVYALMLGQSASYILDFFPNLMKEDDDG